VTAGNVRSARADERIAAAQWEEYKNGITAEVEQAVVAVRDAHDRAQSAVPALEEAREGYRLSEARLKVGAGTQLALYDAQAALIQAEVNAINARYDYLSAIARLARSTGAAAP
jgi:outer membrane protein